MHLAQRTYVLLTLTAILAITGMWSGEPALENAWHWPLALLLLGIALEGRLMRRLALELRIETASRAFLGRPHAATFLFKHDSPRPLEIEYVPVVPTGFDTALATRRVRVPAHEAAADVQTLLPVRLGPQSWPALPARILGPFALAWWSRRLPLSSAVVVAPDALRRAARVRGMRSGARARRVVGAGAELHQLRDYLPGDPLARIDWKATARRGRLVSRELSEDQHLDILVMLDAGRSSLVRTGALDRLGLYANLAARFAERATAYDDQIGLLVFSDRAELVLAPARGLDAVVRLRQALERLEPQRAESDPLAAAVRARGLLPRRSLIVLLTDLEDPAIAPALARAVRLLSPPHVVLLADVQRPELAGLARAPAHDWRDPWVALAAREHETRAASRRALLRRLGAPVVTAPAEQLEQAVIGQYEALRLARRI